MRKLVPTAQRNGYFFALDRVTRKHLVTGKTGLIENMAKGLDEQGGQAETLRRTPASPDRLWTPM